MTAPCAHLAVDCCNELGEMPNWEPRSETLYWIDVIKPGRVFYWDTRTRLVNFWQFDDLICGLAVYGNGDLVLAASNEVFRFDPGSGERTSLYRLRREGERFNDDRCDAAGRYWIGSMADNISDEGQPLPITTRVGALHRISADGTMARWDQGFGCPNAISWNPAGDLMYVADSSDGALYVFAYDKVGGVLSDRRLFCRLPDLGIPDGAAVDQDGFIWNARWGAGVIARISPQGALDTLIYLPVSQPTACAFGGPDLRTLYITSARLGLSAAELAAQPLAGGVFTIEVNVPGLAHGTFGP